MAMKWAPRSSRRAIFPQLRPQVLVRLDPLARVRQHEGLAVLPDSANKTATNKRPVVLSVRQGASRTSLVFLLDLNALHLRARPLPRFRRRRCGLAIHPGVRPLPDRFITVLSAHSRSSFAPSQPPIERGRQRRNASTKMCLHVCSLFPVKKNGKLQQTIAARSR
jgi:hypothetical protein